MSNRLYKASELAELLQVSPKTIYKQAKEGTIESYRIGKSVRFVNPAESERTKQNDKTAREDTELHD